MATVLCGAATWQFAAPVGAAPERTPPTDSIRAVFNDPTHQNDKKREAISNELITLIRNAARGSSIKIAIWEFNDERIREALIAAHYLRKVHVQVLSDGSKQANSGASSQWGQLRLGLDDNPDDDSWARLCAEKNGRGGCIGDRMMHNKFAIFDRLEGPQRVANNVVFQSSANFNPKRSGDGMWNNSVTVVNNPGLYKSYAAYFGLLKDRASPAQLNRHRAQLQDVPGAVSPIYFPFPEEAGDEILNILSSRRVHCAHVGPTTTIRLVAATLSRVAVAERLSAMSEAGCDVHVVYKKAADGQVATDVESALHRRTSLYGGIRLYPECGPLHSKYLLIEGEYNGKAGQKLVWTGSPNFTEPALVHNDEVMLRIEDSDTHDEFRANFGDLVRDVYRYWEGKKTGWPICAKHEADSGTS